MAVQPDLVTLAEPRSNAAEAYRTLRTNLTFAALDEPLRTLVVTSPAPDADKSLVVANLAIAMAQGQRTTILIDADLRRPAIHDLFAMPNDQGLTSLILDKASLDDPPLVETAVEGLWVLPSGPLPPNPADILGSRRMNSTIAAFRERADIVLFDAPPVIVATDAAVLGALADGVLLVVRSGKTRRDYATRARDLLRRVNVRVVGAVLSDAPRAGMLGGY